MKWTKEQESAVFAPVSDTLVTAAAGSGKTQVLSERIVRRITEEDADIDRLLIVTFTRAAAAEMRVRISRTLYSLRSKNERASRQISLISGAKICTIDSFCIDVVKKNFFRLNLPGDFRVGDFGELSLLKAEALTEAVEEMCKKGDEGFSDLNLIYNNKRDDKNLFDMCEKLFDFSETFPYPDKFLNSCKETAKSGDFNNSPIAEFLYDEATELINHAILLTDSSLEMIEDITDFSHYRECFSSDRILLENLLKAKDYKTLYNILSSFSFDTLPSKKGLDEYIKEICKTNRDGVKDAVKKARELIGISPEDADKTAFLLKDRICSLVDTVSLFSKKFLEKKLEKKILSFSDCEHFALSILQNDDLTPSDAAKEIMRYFDEIYIDEYQDSSLVQDEIFRLISRDYIGKPNRFMVGDVKQSIYSFRRADPTIFMDKSDTFSKKEDALKRKIALSKSFRSRKEVVDSINSLFDVLMTEKSSDIDYKKEGRLVFGADKIYKEENPKYKSEILIVKPVSYEQDEDSLSSVEEEMDVVTEKITELVNDPNFIIFDKENNCYRRLKQKDIAILARSVKDADVIEHYLSMRGIKVFSDVGSGLFDALEVRIFTSLLSAIDNLGLDIDLVSVLRSPIFSFSENELYEIRKNRKDVPFYEALSEYCKNDNLLSEKCSLVIEKFNNWRTLSKVMSIERFCSRLLDETKLYAICGALEGGANRQANLRLVLEKAKTFENTLYKGLHAFIKYLDASSKSTDSTVAKDVPKDFDAVRLMSIHKSKGLEFPVVFLIKSSKKINLRSASESIIMEKELGFGIKYGDKRRIFSKTPTYNAISRKIKKDEYAEELRVLYVALSRAREKLFVVGRSQKWATFTQENKPFSKREYDNTDFLSASSFFDWIMLAYFSSASPYWDLSVKEPAGLYDFFEEEKTVEGILPSDEIRRKMAYKNEKSKETSSKISVSELKENKIDAVKDTEIVLSPPSFEKNAVLSPAEKGTAMHKFLENLDFNSEPEYELIKMEREKILSKKEAESIDIGKVQRFLESDIAKRLKEAKWVKREVPFNISLSEKELGLEESDKNVYVQGIIDCYFLDKDDKLVLLDFKTDRTDDTELIKKRYGIQISTYEKALNKKYLQNVDEKLIYLFYNGSTVNF